jgi:acetyl-CoA carboxylase, biotin carboxylase subunit
LPLDRKINAILHKAMIKKILIANRGEIALRIMRTCKEMNIATVAVFSTADRDAPFVRYADQAVCIGAPASNQSYLRIDKIIAAAQATGADAIHPGYGFLSENAEFSEAVKAAGLIFIGPGAAAIRLMGSKLAAKATALAHNIPLVPGTAEAITDIEAAKKIATTIGFPILIKASAGGGGKGMRVVEQLEDFEEQMQRAQSEALSAFGDNSVFIEKFVGSPRHIEIQVLADQHGNVVHLFERECSIQRRHQKVVEEAPSAILDDKMRKAMGDCACMLARACDYEGAGTVEFLVDEQRNFYFLEMNTRLQVEHPVTEFITGTDLVRQQIYIAEGKPLAFGQDDLQIRGHAIELRVYAEDPTNNFLPSIGTLTTYQPPKGQGVRVDDGFVEGMKVPIYYDPMIAKLTTFGATRQEAIDRMLRAISDYHIAGVETTLGFGKYVMQHPAFVSGNFDTNFVKTYFTPDQIGGGNSQDATIAAQLAAFLMSQKGAATNTNTAVSQSGNNNSSNNNNANPSLWKLRTNFA